MTIQQVSPGVPSLEEQAEFYDDWNARFRLQGFDDIEPESKARGNKVLQIIHSLCLKRPTILEVGCGTGWLTQRLATLGEATAIDLSRKAIEIAERRRLGAEFIAGDFFTQDFSLRHFDVAICVETISYVADQRRFIEKLASLIKPGGYLVLTSVNKFVYQRRADIGPPKSGQIRHWLTRMELHRLLKPDFRVVKSVTVLPKGDKGLLRAVNSSRLNWALRCVLSAERISWAKERLGLGHCRVVLGRRRYP